MTWQPAGLILVLRDRSAPHGDRDDAAIDLHAFDDADAESALLAIILDPAEDDDLVDSAAESLSIIWARKAKHPADVIASMRPTARKFFHAAPNA